MKCFVTGASGFIGSNLVRELLARKHRVKALVRPGSDRHGLAGAEVELVTGDVSDRQIAPARNGRVRVVFSLRGELPFVAAGLQADVCHKRGGHVQRD